MPNCIATWLTVIDKRNDCYYCGSTQVVTEAANLNMEVSRVKIAVC